VTVPEPLGTIGVVFDRAPVRYVTTPFGGGGVLIAGPNLLPGWKCTACASYNNIERTVCKFDKCANPRSVTYAEFEQFVQAVRDAGGRITILKRR
jgi:hypothetical protein